jgi:putative endonuclease
MRELYVYILSNPSRTLYTGMTNDLARRLFEHRSGVTPGFTSRYRVTQLVWYQSFESAWEAIECEKRIKGWSRAKKIALIESMNPHWFDLSGNWGGANADSSLRSE